MDKPKAKRGFAVMDPVRQRAIASLGGKSVPNDRRSFSQSRELAAKAGRKGGRAVKPESRSFSQDRNLAASAGRIGGKNVPRDKRAFTRNPELAQEAGRKGGLVKDLPAEPKAG